MTDPEPLDLRSHDVAEDRRQALLRLFPETRTEGRKLNQGLRIRGPRSCGTKSFIPVAR